MYQKQPSRRQGRRPFSRSRAGSVSRFSRPRPRAFARGRGRPSSSRAHHGSYIDPSKFINKAVITEEAAHFVPEHQFTDFAFVEALKKNIVAKGYVTPTPIQDRAIPHILAGQDVVGIANTGTGKTAAFLLPLVDKVLRAPQTEQVLVVVPTRELALQIESELTSFTKGMKLFSVCCVGGAPMRTQLRSLRYRNHFIVGTPGRLKDLIDRGSIRLATFNTIVLDEADQMLDRGFVNDMRFIMEKMPSKRHTLFFSATLSPQIEGLVREFLREPVRISVKTSDTPRSIDQDVVRVTRGADKFDVLRDLLNQKDFSKVLVFARTKHGAERLARQLAAHGLKADAIHGNKSQPQRRRALSNFSNERVQILVATDVAARGLDIANVSHVINYDVPATYDDYVHRIGRTGRGNKRGKALTFIG